MSQPLYAIYGASGFGREAMPIARKMLQDQGVPPGRLVFIDDQAEERVVNGHPVYSYTEFMALEAGDRFVSIAIANSSVREKLAARLHADEIHAWTLRDSIVVVMDEVDLGGGAILSQFVTLTSNIKIGKHFHCNLYSSIGHDSIIGDYVTFAPRVNVNGNTIIEDHVYIGTGALLKQGSPGKPLVIGRGAVIGMGAVVTKDVAPGVTVVGNPARPLVKS